MVAVEKNQPATIQKCQQTQERRSEVIEVEIRSAESFCSTSQFLARGSSLRYFHNCESIHTKGRVGCSCTSLHICFVVQCHFFGSHVGRGHQLIGVWSKHHICFAK